MIGRIESWLDAGVMQDGKWTDTGLGTPQGANVSPVLANVFLHYVLDLGFQQWHSICHFGVNILSESSRSLIPWTLRSRGNCCAQGLDFSLPICHRGGG